MLIMKEEQKILEEKLRALEEGLRQKVPESKMKFQHKTSSCIQYLHLILLLELMLFFAGSCYIIFQKYPSQAPENKNIATTFEKYISVLDSMSEAQKSQPATEMPEKLIKSDVIDVDQLNNLFMGLIKEEESMQNKISATDNAIRVYTSTQNSISVENDNTVRASDSYSWPRMRLSLGNFEPNNEFAKDSVPWQFSSTKYIDDTDKHPTIVRFLERLQDVAEIESKIQADLKDFESKNDFTQDTNRLTSNNQESDGSDVFNELKTLKPYITAITNSEDSMDSRISASLINNLESWKQKLFVLFSDFFEDVPPSGEKSSFSDEINKQATNDLESGYVICPPDESDESLDMSQKSSAKDFFIPQSASTQENLERMENKLNENISASNGDKSNVDDSNVSTSASDASVSSSDDLFLLKALINMENMRSQHSPEIAANIKVDDSTENVNDSPEIWNWPGSIKHLTSNDDNFQWSNAPARFADALQPGPMEISKLNDANTYSFLNEEPEYFEDLIPESRCEVQIARGILVMRCPAVNFDEEWNLTSAETHTSDFPDVNNSEDSFYDFYVDASDRGSTASALSDSSNDRRKRMAVIELEKKLVSIFNNETKSLIDYVNSTKSLLSEDDYIDAIRSGSSDRIFLSLDSWRQQYEAAKKVVGDIRHEFHPKIILSDSSNERKKRMVVTEWQSVENTLEESNENVEILQHLKKIFQRMEILAAYIDRLEERYLLHNKLDDDYVSSEFPMERHRK